MSSSGAIVPASDLPDPPQVGASVPASDLPDNLSTPPAGAAQQNQVMDATKTIGSEVVRPLAKMVAGPALGAMDAGVAARNIIGDVLNRITGKQATPDYEMPSKMFDESLDSVTRAPKDKLGKVLETGEAMLMTPPMLTAEEKVAQLMKGAKLTARDLAMQQAHSDGFSLPPSVTGKAVGKTVQGLAGKAATERDASLKNATRVDDMAKTDLQLTPDEVLTPERLKSIEAPAIGVYEQLANLGRLKPDPKYLADVAASGKEFAHSSEDYPGSVSPDVDKIRSIYLRDAPTARGTIDAMKQLRYESSLDLRSGVPERISVGMVKRDISEAMLDRLDRTAQAVGQPQLVQQFKDARKLLAKAKTIGDSMIGTHVSARSLARLNKSKPGYLDGNLLKIANAADKFSPAFQDVEKKGEWGPYSVVDLLTALFSVGTEAAVSGSGSLWKYAPLAGVAARPAARAALLSKPYQALSTVPAGQTAAAALGRNATDLSTLTQRGLISAEGSGDNGP